MNSIDDTGDTGADQPSAETLANIRDHYDTTCLLRMVDKLDQWISEASSEDGLRDGLLRLHGMAHSAVNGGAVSVAPNDETLPELANELTSQLKDTVAMLQEWIERIRPLEALGGEPMT